MQKTNFPYKGHTEYLTHQYGAEDSLMFMVSDSIKIGVVSNHVPLREVANAVTKEKIVKKLEIMNESLKIDFGKERPTIAVLGLNPHVVERFPDSERLCELGLVNLRSLKARDNGPF